MFALRSFVPRALRSTRATRAVPSVLSTAKVPSLVSKAVPIRAFSLKKNEDGDIEFPGAPGARFTTKLDVLKSDEKIPIYRVMDNLGNILEKDYEVKYDKDELIKMYRTMCKLNALDTIFYDAQRQGRISFYMTSYGEEAAVVGSAAALSPSDLIFGQYRESGAFMWRGFTLDQFANQCFSNTHETGKGRQMPVHYGSAELNIHTISSPLATQIPQAAGAAYAYKREGRDNVVMCYFGEGAASEGDFHAALNAAATCECPVLFFCRNNGFAISTPVKDQFRGDGMASRASGYGIHTIRFDGNDILAVLDATKAAREISLSQNAPVLLEAMSYRVGHHSTSDDSTRYRPAEEIQEWQDVNNPLHRTRLFLEKQGWWDSEKEAELIPELRKKVLTALTKAEKAPKPSLSELFTDVYDTIPPHLLKQRRELEAHLAKHASEYDLSHYDQSK